MIIFYSFRDFFARLNKKHTVIPSLSAQAGETSIPPLSKGLGGIQYHGRGIRFLSTLRLRSK